MSTNSFWTTQIQKLLLHIIMNSMRYRLAPYVYYGDPDNTFFSATIVLPVVGTLRTEYPRVQVSSQDNGSRLSVKGSSEAVMCPRGSGSRFRPGPASGLSRVTWALWAASK
jgi:aminopeptidase-like protein